MKVLPMKMFLLVTMRFMSSSLVISKIAFYQVVSLNQLVLLVCFIFCYFSLHF